MLADWSTMRTLKRVFYVWYSVWFKKNQDDTWEVNLTRIIQCQKNKSCSPKVWWINFGNFWGGHSGLFAPRQAEKKLDSSRKRFYGSVSRDAFPHIHKWKHTVCRQRVHLVEICSYRCLTHHQKNRDHWYEKIHGWSIKEEWQTFGLQIAAIMGPKIMTNYTFQEAQIALLSVEETQLQS